MTPLISALYAIQFAATFVLIIAGGLVTGTGSGLAVPDWPLSFGTLFPEMTGGVFYEHSHRLIAGVVLLISIASTILVGINRLAAEGLKRLALFSLGLVLLQALLGGLTVLLKLPTWTSAAHAVLGPSFLAITAYLFVQVRRLQRAPEGGQVYVRAGSGGPSLILFFWLIWLQFVLGALSRHGITVLIPYHALVGVLLLFHYLATMGKNIRATQAAGCVNAVRLLQVLNGAIILQVLLGVFSWLAILAHPTPEIGNWHRVGVTSAHQSLAALILSAAFLLAYSTFSARPNPSASK